MKDDVLEIAKELQAAGTAAADERSGDGIPRSPGNTVAGNGIEGGRGGQMKIRLDGTRDEIREALDDLRAVLDVSSVSEFYPDRGSKTAGRVYLEAGRRSADGDLRGRFDPDTVEALQGIQDNVYTARGWQCMPAGNEWLRGLLEMCAGILDAGLLDDITRDDLDQLTAENFHAVRHAAGM